MTGKHATVLEPCCGPAPIIDFLDKNTSFSGFDINHVFIDSLKEKGIDAKKRDAMDLESYKKADVVLLCDALHHIAPKNQKQLIENSYRSAKKKLIICDPYRIDNPGENRLKKKISGFVHDYMDKDGSNQVRLEDIRTKDELMQQMESGFGVVPPKVEKTIKTIGKDLIVTYDIS